MEQEEREKWKGEVEHLTERFEKNENFLLAKQMIYANILSPIISCYMERYSRVDIRLSEIPCPQIKEQKGKLAEIIMLLFHNI